MQADKLADKPSPLMQPFFLCCTAVLFLSPVECLSSVYSAQQCHFCDCDLEEVAEVLSY